MFRKLYNFIKHFIKGTCPECGLYTSEFAQSEDEHDRMMHMAMGTCCMHPFHDNLIDHLYECAYLTEREYGGGDYDPGDPFIFH